jgi:ribosomal protein S18 acetylase RimI-like enzyme
VFRPPLERSLTWPFQPHVTVLDGGSPERIRAAVDALAGFTAEVVLDRVHLLEEERDDDGARRWRSIAESTFDGPAVVGRGGLELELEVVDRLSRDALAFRDRAFDEHHMARFGSTWATTPLAVVARRAGRIVATADGEVRPDGEVYLAQLIVDADVRDEGIGAHVLAAFVSAAAEHGSTFITLRTDDGGAAERFYARLGFRRTFPLPSWRGSRDFVQMRKDL